METLARARRGLRPVLLVVLPLLVASLLAWFVWLRPDPAFTTYPMPSGTDIPTAIAVAPDGTVWFTIEFSDAIGLLRNGRVEKIRKGKQNVEPLGLAVDAGGAVWYTDGPIRAISRLGADGAISSFPLATPIAKLARLAIAPDGAVWFAESTMFSVTRLKDGVFTRHEVSSLAAVPFGVALDAQGTVWATLQNVNRLLRISPDGELTELDAPTRAAGLGDIAVDAGGAVWFLEIRANQLGRYADGRFSEFRVPTPKAGLTALAVAPDGAIWFTELRAQRLGRWRDGVVTEFRVPHRSARPFGIAVDSGGNVWYTDLSGRVGRLAAERARAPRRSSR